MSDMRFFTSGRIVPMSKREVKEHLARKKQMEDDNNE
jgi:hypothetical protein